MGRKVSGRTASAASWRFNLKKLTAEESNGRKGTKRRGGICLSVEAVDCKSGIFQVPDLNLEEKQRRGEERRDGLHEASAERKKMTTIEDKYRRAFRQDG